MLQADGSSGAAVHVLRRILELEPDNPRAHFALGQVLPRLQDCLGQWIPNTQTQQSSATWPYAIRRSSILAMVLRLKILSPLCTFDPPARMASTPYVTDAAASLHDRCCRRCKTGGLRRRLTGRAPSMRRTPSSSHVPTSALAWRLPSFRCVRLKVDYAKAWPLPRLRVWKC